MKPKYSSGQDHIIYQRNPLFSKPSQFRAKGWTDTIESYIYEANKLRTLLFLNRKASKKGYSFHITINFDNFLTPKELGTIWTKATRRMREKGIVAVWVMEPTRSGKFHFHMLLKNDSTEKELRRIFEDALPKKQPGQRRGWRMKTQKVTPGGEWELENYVCKAKKGGYAGGQWTDDYYARKRLLFVPRLGVKKSGWIGEFWTKSKGQLWKEVTDREERISEGLQKPGVRELAKHIHVMLGEQPKLRDIERSYGYSADEPWVQEWIDQITNEQAPNSR